MGTWPGAPQLLSSTSASQSICSVRPTKSATAAGSWASGLVTARPLAAGGVAGAIGNGPAGGAAAVDAAARSASSRRRGSKVFWLPSATSRLSSADRLTGRFPFSQRSQEARL